MNNKIRGMLFLMATGVLCACTPVGGSSSSTNPTNTSDGSTTTESTSNSSETSTSETSTSKDDNGVFNPDKVVLSFPAISDEHIGFEKNEEIMANGLRYLQEQSSRPFDLVLSAGDQTQNGTLAETQKLMETYKSVFDINKTPFFFAHGNHDTYWSGCMNTTQFYDAYGPEVYQYDLDQDSAKLGNRHAKIGGYHFVSIQVKTFMPNYNDYTPATEDWVLEVLNEARRDTPDKPIFVVTHSPAYGTVYGSMPENSTADWGASKSLTNLLRNQPNVILLSGHTHYAPHDERNIFQDNNFTAINIPSLSDIAMDTNVEGVTELPDRRSYSFGNIIEVDENNNVKITRYDIKNEWKIKQSWVVPAPARDRSHLIPYSNAYRLENNKAPTFDGEFVLTHDENDHLIMDFDSFKDDDMIFCYKARVFIGNHEDVVNEEDDYIADLFIMDEWYKYPNGVTGKHHIQLDGKYTKRSAWTVKLYACDSFGGEYGLFPTETIIL